MSNQYKCYEEAYNILGFMLRKYPLHEMFYAISASCDDVALQGTYDPEIAKCLHNDRWTKEISTGGMLRAETRLKNQVKIRIVLT